MGTYNIVSKEVKDKIIEEYLKKPITINNIAKSFNLCAPTIMNILNEYNIKRYTKSELYNPDFISNYFESIDTEAKAYFLGFILTDGNIFYPQNNREALVSITQNESDKYILDIFKNEVKTNRNISFDGRGACYIAVSSNKMAMDLSKYGIVPNKSLIKQLFFIDPLLMRHYIRGIFDGDGNITSSITLGEKGARHRHKISFCGPYIMMEQIKQYISYALNITSDPLIYTYSNRNLSEVKWGSIEDIYKIGEWFYRDSTIFLRRKYNTYMAFKRYYELI